MRRTLNDIRVTCELAMFLNPDSMNKAVRRCAITLLGEGVDNGKARHILHQIKNSKNPMSTMHWLTRKVVI